MNYSPWTQRSNNFIGKSSRGCLLCAEKFRRYRVVICNRRGPTTIRVHFYVFPEIIWYLLKEIPRPRRTTPDICHTRHHTAGPYRIFATGTGPVEKNSTIWRNFRLGAILFFISVEEVIFLCLFIGPRYNWGPIFGFGCL